MPDKMYPGMDDDAEPMSNEPGEPPHKESEEEGETALLPKSFFEGQELKPGQQYYVEIVRAYEDEVEVRYPHEVKEEGEGESEDKESANSKLDAMGTEMGGGY